MRCVWIAHKVLLLTIERSALYFSRISRGDAHD